MTKSEFEKLYQENFSGVYRYLLKLCQNQHLAEEITSDTFFKAMKAIDKFEGRCDVNSWLCQIAKNSYYNYLRKTNRLVEIDTLLEQEDPNIDIENEIVNSSISQEIKGIVNELEEPYKKVFTLRVICELSFKEIAHCYGKTENWACVTYHRAKSKIKKRMEG